MSKTFSILLIIIIIVIILGIWYFVSSSAQPAPAQQNAVENNNQNNPSNTVPTTPATSTPASTTNEPATPSSVSVNIQSFAFSPATLNIKKGTKVTWTNSDNVPHTVTSDSGNLLNSGTIAPGASFSFTFINNGSTGYHCSVHPKMKGSVVVN